MGRLGHFETQIDHRLGRIEDVLPRWSVSRTADATSAGHRSLTP